MRQSEPEAASWGENLAYGYRLLAPVSDTARLDSELLLMQVTGASRSQLRTWPERLLQPAQQQAFHDLLDQRLQGQPVAYLLGQREFWSRSFSVTSDTLIPRPDSECLVEEALLRLDRQQPCDVLDLGTGSGILAITLALECPNACVYASDISWPSLQVARDNARQLGAKIMWLASDWMRALGARAQFDLILSNPPYLAEDDPHLAQGDLRFEPLHALASGPDGLDAMRQLTATAQHHLKPQGWLLVEHGYDQGDAVAALFAMQGYAAITQQRDLGGMIRVTAGQKAG